MKIDKEKLKALAALPDEEIWKKAEEIAKAYGIKLPTTPPPHAELEKLRAAIKADKLSPIDAMRIVNKIKKGDYNG